MPNNRKRVFWTLLRPKHTLSIVFFGSFENRKAAPKEQAPPSYSQNY